jgi:hypothetical protein
MISRKTSRILTFTVMLMYFAFMGCLLLAFSGCNMRFAPTEAQKQNAMLHNQTTAALAAVAHAENAGPRLTTLADLCNTQSAEFVRYYGMPAQVPIVDNTPVTPQRFVNAEPNVIAAASQTAQQASQDAAKRPDPWQAAESLLGVGLAIATILGGSAGVKLAAVLKAVKEKTMALREIVEANEYLKSKTLSDQQLQVFKDTNKLVQSDSTVKQVDAIRQELAAKKV